MFASVDRVLCEGPHMGDCLVALGCPRSEWSSCSTFGRRRAEDRVPAAAVGGRAAAVLPRRLVPREKGFPDALDAIGLLQREQPDLPLEITVDRRRERRPAQRPRGRSGILATIARHGLQARTRLLGYQPYAVFFREAYAGARLRLAQRDRERRRHGGRRAGLADRPSRRPDADREQHTHCDIPSVVLHGKSGLLAGEHDVPGLLAHLRWLVANPDRWLELATAGRRHVEAELRRPRAGGAARRALPRARGARARSLPQPSPKPS
jgi:colanic acid/amylovoran biosynthesis glycosyltransferase